MDREEIRRRRMLAARRGEATDLTIRGDERQDGRGKGNIGKGVPASRKQRAWFQRQREA